MKTIESFNFLMHLLSLWAVTIITNSDNLINANIYKDLCNIKLELILSYLIYNFVNMNLNKYNKILIHNQVTPL
jgi:hypothetical protein